jgi:hypothetical protein
VVGAVREAAGQLRARGVHERGMAINPSTTQPRFEEGTSAMRLRLNLPNGISTVRSG